MHATCAEFNQFDTALVQQFVLSCTQSAADPLIRTDWIENDESEEIDGSENGSENNDDLSISPGTSREDSTSNNNSDSHIDGSDRQEDNTSEEKETVDEREYGIEAEDSNPGEYTITITGDYECLNEFLKERDDERFDNDGDDEIVEYDFISDNEDLYRDGSPEQSDSENGTYSSEVGTDDSDYQNLVVTELGYISGFLCFIIVIICLKYIYKFFKLFF